MLSCRVAYGVLRGTSALSPMKHSDIWFVFIEVESLVVITRCYSMTYTFILPLRRILIPTVRSSPLISARKSRFRSLGIVPRAKDLTEVKFNINDISFNSFSSISRHYRSLISHIMRFDFRRFESCFSTHSIYS